MLWNGKQSMWMPSGMVLRRGKLCSWCHSCCLFSHWTPTLCPNTFQMSNWFPHICFEHAYGGYMPRSASFVPVYSCRSGQCLKSPVVACTSTQCGGGPKPYQQLFLYLLRFVQERSCHDLLPCSYGSEKVPIQQVTVFSSETWSSNSGCCGATTEQVTVVAPAY